ncbi:MAG TPA: response regulator [Candidatus Paceibacterota bacterium]|nr:response regulator [Candidatus Paceibacterota bacterium]
MEKKILIVEDEEMIRSPLVQKLNSENLKVLEADNGDDGFQLALTERPAVILLDISLPTISGMQVMKMIREKDEWGKKVPIIILTNLEANDEIMDGVVNDNPAYYIVKANSTLESVVEKIKSCLPL